MSTLLKPSRFTCPLFPPLRFVYHLLLIPLLYLAHVPLHGQESDGKVETQGKAHTNEEYLSQHALTVYANDAKKWNDDVLKLSHQNGIESNVESILFIGSSTIRLWDSLEQDVAPYKTVKRGYGGAKFCDLAIHCPTLIKGLKFRAAVIFVANDITGSTSDKEPVEIKRLARITIESLKASNPSAPVILLSITATPSRFAHWSRIQSANRTLRTLADEIPGVTFLETEKHYLAEDGKPIDEYFVEDRLHQTSEGYRLLGSLVKSKLDDILNTNASR
jgi:hypothetical protein